MATLVEVVDWDRHGEAVEINTRVRFSSKSAMLTGGSQ